MSERTITIPVEEYEELKGYRLAVMEKGKAVFERRVTTENGERHEEMLIYTHEDFQKKIEDMCDVLYSAGKVEESSPQELFALRSQVNRLKSSLALQEHYNSELRKNTVSKELYEAIKEVNVELQEKIEELKQEPPYKKMFNTLLFFNFLCCLCYVIGEYILK